MAVVFLTLPGIGYRLNLTRIEVHEGGQPYFFHAGESAAFDYLERLPKPGGVLAPVYSGLAVPYRTGRHTWVGQFSYTPNFRRRAAQAEALFMGELDRSRAVQLVRDSGARFLYADCQKRTDLERLLRPYLRSVHRFGCATVYELHSAGV